MIEYIKGQIAEITPTTVVLDNQGMGYLIQISINTYTAIQHQGETKIFITEIIREDAHILYGFAQKHERELFLLLNTVSGVGPNTARMILSSIPPQELEQVILNQQDQALKAVKGIGAKTAQRIIVDLKDKIKTSITPLDSLSLALPIAAADEAISALVTLGFPQNAVQKCVQKLIKDDPSLKVEQVIKAALKML